MRATLLILIAATVTLTQCATRPKPVENPDANQKWQGNMHAMASALADVLPLVNSTQAFYDPHNDARIIQSVQTLVKSSHAIDASRNKPASDPAVEYSAQEFAGNMNDALTQLKAGNRPLARRLIQESTSYCISCHTRTDQGRANLQFSSLADLSRLSQLEQMDFFIAVRDYDRALNSFDKVVNSQQAQIENPFVMEVAAQKALAIAVRVKRDPNLANELVSRIVDAQWAPVYLRLSSLTWKKEISDWQRQRTKPITLNEAKTLLNHGWRLSSTSPRGQAGLIFFLRASTTLHELLDRESKGRQSAETLYYAGLAAESLRDINLWTLHDYYFESCIRQSPHSNLAKRCYLRFEGNQYVTYGGSAGLYLPGDIRQRMEELKRLAETESDRLENWNLKGE